MADSKVLISFEVNDNQLASSTDKLVAYNSTLSETVKKYKEFQLAAKTNNVAVVQAATELTNSQRRYWPLSPGLKNWMLQYGTQWKELFPGSLREWLMP